MVHRTTQRAAETSRLIAPARLFTAKDDMYLRMATFSSAVIILSALRAAQTGDQVATPFAAVATAIACSANVLPDIRAALLQTSDRATLWTAPVGAVATAARPEDLRSIEAAVKDQGGMSSLPAWARAATQHVPGAATSPPPPPRSPTPGLASARVPAQATMAAAPQPTAPPTPQYPPGHTPHLASFPMPWPTSPAPARWAPPATPAQSPPPAPWTHQPQVPVAATPWQAACAAQPPPPQDAHGLPCLPLAHH